MHCSKLLLEDEVDAVPETLLAVGDLLELSKILLDVFDPAGAVVLGTLDGLTGIVLCTNVHHHSLTVLQLTRNIKLKKKFNINININK